MAQPLSRLLLVEDDLDIQQVACMALETVGGYTVKVCSGGEEALARLAKGDIDVALCDIRLPDIDGLEVMQRTLEAGVETSFLVMTAFASVGTAINAMKGGAFDYLIKPLRHEDVLHRLSQVAELMGLREENRRLRDLVPENEEQRCVLPSKSMQEVYRLTGAVLAVEGVGEPLDDLGVVGGQVHCRPRRRLGCRPVSGVELHRDHGLLGMEAVRGHRRRALEELEGLGVPSRRPLLGRRVEKEGEHRPKDDSLRQLAESRNQEAETERNDV